MTLRAVDHIMFESMPSSLRSIVLQAPNLRLTPLLVRDLKAAVLPALDCLTT